MKIRISSPLPRNLLAAGLAISFTLALAAQPSGSDGVAAQRQAMSQLSFLAGDWSGPVNIVRGPGEALHLTQNEHVEYKLDGLVLLIEGKSTEADVSTIPRAGHHCI